MTAMNCNHGVRAEFTTMHGGMSSPFWWDQFDRFSELPVKARIHGTIPDSPAGRIHPQIIAAFPVDVRTDRPGTKTAAAIWADILQDVFNASTAERAFKRANHRVRGIRRKRRVAVLASRSQFEHSCAFVQV